MHLVTLTILQLRSIWGHYGILKINPNTHKVENLFSKKSGLLNGYNYNLVAGKDAVWVGTFNGVGMIDTKTNNVNFYIRQLGISGTDFSIRSLLVDQDYVWVEVESGGLALYMKQTHTWHAFTVKDLMKHDSKQFYLERPMKIILGGIQIAFRDGMLNSEGNPDRLVEKQHHYASGNWTNLPVEHAASGIDSSQTENYLESVYPKPHIYTNEDVNGLTQIQMPLSGTRYQLDGRDNYYLSQVITNKRYVLTSASIDVLDNTTSFRKMLVKLGSRIEEGLSAPIELFQSTSNFLIDPASMKAIVLDSSCAGQGCNGKQKLWLVDLNAGTILKIYTETSGFSTAIVNNYDVSSFTMKTDGKVFTLIDKKGKNVVVINLTSLLLTDFTK